MKAVTTTNFGRGNHLLPLGFNTIIPLRYGIKTNNTHNSFRAFKDALVFLVLCLVERENVDVTSC